MGNIKVSIFLSVYNGGASFEKCLGSLTVQDYPRDSYEIIVVDDASTDGSHILAEKYADRVFSFDSNSGVVKAHKKCLDLSTGDILISIDADVILPHDALKKVTGFFERNPDVDALTGMQPEFVVLDRLRLLPWSRPMVELLRVGQNCCAMLSAFSTTQWPVCSLCWRNISMRFGIKSGRAMTYLRSKSNTFNIADSVFSEIDTHIHVPEGAIAKDGPSAGVAMVVSLASLFTARPVRKDVAMTGEITLRGDVLPVGGIKEKVIAAVRAGITDIILPHLNEKDIIELPENVKEGIRFHLVQGIEEALEIALEKD